VIRTEAVRYLIAKGWPMRQASALVGVFMDGEEIDIRPDRHDRFHDYASSNGGLDLHDSATRLNFLGWELGNGYAALGSKFFAADTVERPLDLLRSIGTRTWPTSSARINTRHTCTAPNRCTPTFKIDRFCNGDGGLLRAGHPLLVGPPAGVHFIGTSDLNFTPGRLPLPT